MIPGAVKDFIGDVKEKKFPTEEHSFSKMRNGAAIGTGQPRYPVSLTMQIIETISAMRRLERGANGRQGRRIAFVPTMGFLHEGHLCLVRDAKKRGDRVVVSIFVNPTQFGPNEDFAAYPRDFERDYEICLRKRVIDIVFHPSVESMYPEGAQTHVEVEKLSLPLCGAARPGHFRGVATVVAKLFNIVQPACGDLRRERLSAAAGDPALVRDLNMDVEIVGHPIVREADGLAMSSRNAYLTPEERQARFVCPARSARRSVWSGAAKLQRRSCSHAFSAELARRAACQGGIC